MRPNFYKRRSFVSTRRPIITEKTLCKGCPASERAKIGGHSRLRVRTKRQSSLTRALKGLTSTLMAACLRLALSTVQSDHFRKRWKVSRVRRGISLIYLAFNKFSQPPIPKLMRSKSSLFKPPGTSRKGSQVPLRKIKGSQGRLIPNSLEVWTSSIYCPSTLLRVQKLSSSPKLINPSITKRKLEPLRRSVSSHSNTKIFHRSLKKSQTRTLSPQLTMWTHWKSNKGWLKTQDFLSRQNTL